MKSEASILATQIRYQQWIQDIQECNARPTGVTVNDWCAEHHINRNSYYYRMKVLRKVYLDDLCTQGSAGTDCQEPDNTRFVELHPANLKSSEPMASSAIIRIGNASIELSDTITEDFLQRIVGVVSRA
jgi:hypothetical protein